MANPDRPFSETEKVNLLAEIIKASEVPHTALLNIIYDFHVEPQWHEVSRPAGRPSGQCQAAFDEIRSKHPPPFAPPSARPPTATFQPAPQFVHPPFGPYEGTVVAPGSRNIQPRPEGVPHVAYPAATSPYALQAPEQGFKKRGRPSNAEMELRRQEAEKRGEIYVPSRSRKRSKMARGGTVTSPKSTRGPTGQPGESASGASSQRGSYPNYSEPSPSSAGPARRSPGPESRPGSEQKPPMPPYEQERSYGPPSHLPHMIPQTPHHTPTQQQLPRQQPLPPPEHHGPHQPRLPSPPPYQRPPSMPLQGPTLPRLMQSPLPTQAHHSRPSSQSFQRPPEAARRPSPPETSAGEPMEH